MNKKIFFVVTLIFITTIISHSSAWSKTQGDLYSNDEYKFKIRFPLGWEVKDGDGKRVVKKAVDSKSSSSISISVAKYTAPHLDKGIINCV